MSSAHPKWPPERLDQLKAMLPERMSASVMGEELGVTRNAVIGIINRRGLRPDWGGGSGLNGRRGKSLRRGPKQKIERKPVPVADVPVVALAAPMRAVDRKPITVSPPPARPKSVAVAPVLFMARRMHVECAAILNDGAPVEELMCCGSPIPPNQPFDFCADHLAVFLTPPPRRWR